LGAEVQSSKSRLVSLWIPLSFCICTGLLDGSLMVPFKLSQGQSQNKSSHSPLTNSLCYIASFGISTAFVSPVLFLLYSATVNNMKLPTLHVREALVPGVLSGMLYGSANFMSVHATYYMV